MAGVGDGDVGLLAEYSKALQGEYEEDDETWEGSLFVGRISSFHPRRNVEQSAGSSGVQLGALLPRVAGGSSC